MLPSCCLIFRALAWCIVEPCVDVRSSTCRTSYYFCDQILIRFLSLSLGFFTFAQGMINSQSCGSNLRLLAFSLQKFDMSNFPECSGAVADLLFLYSVLS